MSKVLQDYFPRSISQYVPLMEFAADVVEGVHTVNLGAPSTADTDGILDGVSATNSDTSYNSGTPWAITFDGSSTHIGESTAGTLNARFGRCLQIVGTTGSDHVVTISGRDYLGQSISEVLTLSGTSVLYGEKAFKYIDTVAVASGASGDTFDLGWTDRLGLPYAAENVLSWKEDGVLKELGTYQLLVQDVDAVSADTVFAVSDEPGFITRMDTNVTTALGSGDAVLTVEIGGTAVAGLSVTVAGSAAIGVLDTDTNNDDHGATTKIGQYSQIEVVGDGGSATTGTIDARIVVHKNMFFTDADDTTATTTTGDPRGTVQPHTSCDASVEYEVRYTCDTTNLHGVVAA